MLTQFVATRKASFASTAKNMIKYVKCSVSEGGLSPKKTPRSTFKLTYSTWENVNARL